MSLPIGFDRISWKQRKPWGNQNIYDRRAYRLASIGLVGNSSKSIAALHWSVTLTDWLRSDWLETKNRSNSISIHSLAYRLASIGLVENGSSRITCLNGRLAYRSASIGLVGNSEPQTYANDRISGLPIGFDRIGWKHEVLGDKLGDKIQLTDWLRSD